MSKFHFTTIALLVISGVFIGSGAQTNACGGCGLAIDATIKANEILALNASDYYTSSSIDAKTPLVIIGDGMISSIWDEVINYPISTFGESAGAISSIYDQYFVYFLFTHEINTNWVAVQWDSTHSVDAEEFETVEMEPMHSGDDMWVFGETRTISIFGDSHSNGQIDPFVSRDIQDDIFWERVEIGDDSGVSEISYEIMRALNTGDTEGHDAIFSQSSNITGLIASNTFHKIENQISTIKFVLSPTKLLSGEPRAELNGDNSVKARRNGPYYLFSQITLGILVGSIFFAFTVRVSIKALNEEIAT